MVTQGDFDGTAVQRLRDLGGDTLVTRIATVFDSFAAARMADASEGGASGDLPRVASAAHALRSSAANVGALRLLAVATELEHAARASRSEAVPSLVADLQDAFDNARVFVHGFTLRGAA
jgi:HPt (histidine-containing phosphotransfer) domain-containing protein